MTDRTSKSARNVSEICAYYCRTNNGEAGAASIERQIAACDDYARRQGLTKLPGGHVFVDDRLSGMATEGSGLAAALAAARRGDIGKLLVTEPERISRDAHLLGGRYRELDQLDVEIHLTGSRPGKFGDGEMLLWDYEEERFRRRLGEMIAAARWEAASRGAHLGVAPYGFRKVAKGRLAIYQPEAQVVAWIYAKDEEGWTAGDMVFDLDERGVPAPGGGLWTARMILGSPVDGYGILRNPLNMGLLVFGRTETVTETRGGRTVRVRRPRPPSDWICVPVPALQIVDQERWRRSNLRHARRDRAPMVLH